MQIQYIIIIYIHPIVQWNTRAYFFYISQWTACFYLSFSSTSVNHYVILSFYYINFLQFHMGEIMRYDLFILASVQRKAPWRWGTPGQIIPKSHFR